MTITLPLILDGIIVLLLVATILFAARLSVHLQAFRSNRAELENLVKTLADQIAQADRAVAGMRESAREGGRDLQERINEARALTEELQFMNETGNNLAGRLEKAATSPARASGAERDANAVRGGFAIRDPEFGLEDADDEMDEAFFLEDDDAPADGLQSRAERELFEALQGNGRGKAGRS
ncbi:MAG: hypothetical protein KKA05_08285 [Alphaproteobacteria bacterium]|nr:hypothetical protein [Alphaproteobacteria bacterium]MBU0858592.1 hypothetical protein [Alphaproteobacteria bacterium]